MGNWYFKCASRTEAMMSIQMLHPTGPAVDGAPAPAYPPAWAGW